VGFSIVASLYLGGIFIFQSNTFCMNKIVFSLILLFILVLFFGCTVEKSIERDSKYFCDSVEDCALTSLDVIDNNSCEICCNLSAVNKDYAKNLQDLYPKVCPNGSKIMCECGIDPSRAICSEHKCVLAK
jgi:hypothetical protein